jgi:hypothetical protein
MTRWWRPSAALAAAVLGIFVSSCDSSGAPSASQSSNTGAFSAGSPSSMTTTPPKGNIPNKVPDQGSVRPDVQLINCQQTKGGWSAGGTVQNSLRRRTTYIITVFFTSAQATDLASAVTSVPLAAGQSKLWSTQATFAAAGQVLCVLRGVAAR